MSAACIFPLARSIGNGFTANLNIDYRAPVAAGSDIRIEVEVDRIEGRKVFLTGRIVDATSSALYTEGKALFIVKAVPTSDKLYSSMQSAVSNEGVPSTPSTSAAAAAGTGSAASTAAGPRLQ